MVDNPNFKKPEKLGSGAYGTVYSNNPHTAVKITPIGNWDNLQSTLREIRSLRQLNSLNHPFFVKLKKTKYFRNKFHVFMARADTNLHMIHKKDLTMATIKKWCIQLFEGLFFMRKHGIYHRDIKPENILVDLKRGNLWYCDFGLSRFLHNDSEYGTGYIVTRWYRSPELLKHQQVHKRKANLTYTEKMDVWSIGAIMYEMIFCRTLAPGKTIEDVLKIIDRRILGPEPRNTSVLRLENDLKNNKKADSALSKCLLGVLRIDESKRFSAARALCAIGKLTADQLLDHEDEKKSSLAFAPIQPDKDTYTSDEWNKRADLVLETLKRHSTQRKVIAYALVVLDNTSDHMIDLKTRWYVSVMYAGLVLGGYYNNEKCASLIRYARSKMYSEESTYSWNLISEAACKMDFIEVSEWEKGNHTSFTDFINKALKNPHKKRRN